MSVLRSIIDQFQSFVGGPRLIDGGQLGLLVGEIFQERSGLVALAGGGQTGATVLSTGYNEVATVATAADSVMLPPAIPGRTVYVLNSTANSMQVFGTLSNPNNAGASDTIGAQGSAQAASGTGVAQSAHTVALYICAKMGEWRQTSLGA